MSTTKKYLDYDGLVQYTGKVKKAINDASYTHGVTDIEGTPSASAPSIANDLNATNNARSGNFTVNGSADTFQYYDTTYGDASTTKDGLMTHEDKTKLDGIASGAEVNVQSDWSQTTTTADDYIKNKPAVNKVKQTSQSGSTALPILVSAQSSPTSGTDYEAGYDTDFKFKPSDNTLTIGTATVTPTAYSGKATQTETDLGTVATGKGAEMVQYSATKTVAGAISDLENAIGGSGGSSIMDLIEDLQEGDNLVAGSNITLTPDTTNHQVSIAAADEKVSQTSDTSTSSAIPLLLASGATPTSPAGAKYNSNLGFTPSTSTLKIGSGTLTATNYSGTAAKATADGSGNNIANTYATKAALDALSNKWTGQFKIASSAEATAIAGKDASGLELGYIYLVEDSNASSPNVYDEYIKVALGTTPETYSVEKIGTTDAGVDVVSLTTSEINTIWSTTAAAS